MVWIFPERKLLPCASIKIDSSKLVLPAPLSPYRRLTPLPGLIDTSCRFLTPWTSREDNLTASLH